MEISTELLLQRIEDLESQMQQVRSKSIDEAAIKVKVGVFICPAATGYKVVTGVGFKPRYVDFMVGWTGADYIRAGSGWMDYNGNQGSLSWGVTTTVSRAATIIDTACINDISGAGVNEVLATYVSMNADGFTINFSVTNAAHYVTWKAVR